MAGQNTFHDGNHVAVIAGVSSDDGKTIVLPWVDPTTHRLLVTATGGATTVYTETPSGAINGSNTVYTVNHSITSIFSFAINGMYLHPFAGGVGDYTFSGTTITFVSPLPAQLAGTAFTLVYQ